MSKQERVARTLEILDQRRFMTIGELATVFQVSEMTIRRDLWELNEDGKVRMVYGGVTAIGKDGQGDNYTVDAEHDQHSEEKQRIALRAAEMISPGDVVFLDSGTTIQQLAECLPRDGAYTFICYSLNTINVVAKRPESTVISPGGIFSPKSLVFSGPDAVSTIRRYRANKALIGATGYDMKQGLTCAFVEDCALKEAAIDSSVERILLLDSSKFGKVSACSFAALDSFNKVVTDSGIPQAYVEHLRARVPEVVIV
jgi:DeoR family deoxyribose operon repressor